MQFIAVYSITSFGELIKMFAILKIWIYFTSNEGDNIKRKLKYIAYIKPSLYYLNGLLLKKDKKCQHNGLLSKLKNNPKTMFFGIFSSPMSRNAN